MQDQHESDQAETIEVVSSPKTTPAGLTIDPNGVTVFVEYLPDKQAVQVDYDKKKVKTWDFIIGMLEMAVIQAKTRRDMQIACNIQASNEKAAREQMEAIETKMMALKLANEQNNRLQLGSH